MLAGALAGFMGPSPGDEYGARRTTAEAASLPVACAVQKMSGASSPPPSARSRPAPSRPRRRGRTQRGARRPVLTAAICPWAGAADEAAPRPVAVPSIIPRIVPRSGFPSGPRRAASWISASCCGVSGRRRAMVRAYSATDAVLPLARLTAQFAKPPAFPFAQAHLRAARCGSAGARIHRATPCQCAA